MHASPEKLESMGEYHDRQYYLFVTAEVLNVHDDDELNRTTSNMLPEVKSGKNAHAISIEC